MLRSGQIASSQVFIVYLDRIPDEAALPVKEKSTKVLLSPLKPLIRLAAIW